MERRVWILRRRRSVIGSLIEGGGDSVVEFWAWLTLLSSRQFA